MFESGNLDVAVQVQPEEFNLYLKADTNTRGYCNWFFFKVTRKPDKGSVKFQRKKFMFNILNMYKKKTLFKKDAKPLACKREILPNGFFSADFDTQKWKNNHISNVHYIAVGPSISSAPLQPDNYEQATGARAKRQKYYCLSFDYEFQ